MCADVSIAPSLSSFMAVIQKPFQLSFITEAAIKEPVLTPTGHLTDADKDQTRDKIRTILCIGLKHGHDCLLLGALGCGAYGNSPADVARLFHEVIEEEEFRDKYKMLAFAITGQRCYMPFKRVFDSYKSISEVSHTPRSSWEQEITSK